MDSRPNPDEILAQVRAEQARSKRGTLKIFFGYAAGVGKTYSMLQAARQAQSTGCDVVVGYVEPHGRRETEALLEGLEILPTRPVEHRGVVLREFDVDAALARHPELLLVDELAHSNTPGSRHAKRWQDVSELLDAGINVWTTLNVQHLESLNDVIGQITGIVVRETVPDYVLEMANDLELCDITPEELLTRLKEGKVYVPAQAQRAIQNFFQTPNLTALRELSLRQTANRIHADVETARRLKAATVPWATAERLLVCVGPSPTTSRVIRTAKRMAAALDAPWIAVAVDLTGERASSETKRRIAEHFSLAERLGAEIVMLAGQQVVPTIMDFARERNVTKIFIGKTGQPRWRRILFRSIVDDLLENSGKIDVYVIHGEEPAARGSSVPPVKSAPNWYALGSATAIIALCGILAAVLRNLRFADAQANQVMIFLAGVALVAFRLGRIPSVWASILAVLVFDFVFVPPFYTFAAADTKYLVTFGVMLAIGLVISTLTSGLKAQVESSRERERHTSVLYHLGKQLSSLYGRVFLVSAVGEKVAEIYGGEVAVYLRSPSGAPQLVFGEQTAIAAHPISVPVAQWVIDHDQPAGAGTNTLPNAAALFLPLSASQQPMGAIAVRVPHPERLLAPEQRRLLEACASQLAIALERDQWAIDASEARIQKEAEQVRSTLLSGVSHDLKTPLAAIAGASSTLLQGREAPPETQRELLETISEEATRLNRLLENILQISRLNSGAVAPNKQWHLLEEIVGSALQRIQRELVQHQVDLRLPSQLPMISVDGLLLEQVFVNLLENAAHYTPPGSRIVIAASTEPGRLIISVADNGPGLPPGSEEKIFERFYRGAADADAGRASGLGLAICRAILKLHGGTITAQNRPQGGAEFLIRLPLADNSPQATFD